MAGRRTIGIFGLLIMVLGIFAGFIYYSSLVESSIPMPPKNYPDLLQFRNVSLNFSVLDRESFDNLETFGDVPVKPGVTGRQDIFAPF